MNRSTTPLTLREKLALEDGKRIRLYKQGLFWTAYAHSALLLCREKPLKIYCRRVAALQQEVWQVYVSASALLFFSAIFGPFVREGKHAATSTPATGLRPALRRCAGRTRRPPRRRRPECAPLPPIPLPATSWKK